MARPINRMRPVHPGEVLREDYLVPLGLSVNALSIALGVPATRIHMIVKENRPVTADTAARLANYFGGDATSWLVMQANYDLKTLPALAEIQRQVPVREQLRRRELGIVNTPRPWNLLTNNRLSGLSLPQQFACLAFAYLESAQLLCDDIADNLDSTTFERGLVVLYLSAHAVELFLKGAIIRKAPKERLSHDLEHIYNRYKTLFPAKRFALTKMPFTTEFPGKNKQEIAEAKRKMADPSEIYRYTVDGSGKPWNASLGFEAGSFSKALLTLHADFKRVLGEHDAALHPSPKNPRNRPNSSSNPRRNAASRGGLPDV